MRLLPCLGLIALAPLALQAQAAASTAAAPAPDAQQVAAAVLPLPKEFRATAIVLGYHAGTSQLVTLRQGSGPFTCLATNPANKQFHVACYHSSMEAFMERGRALRASGVKGDQVDSVRFAEVRSGKLVMPTQPAALYSITGPTAPAAGADSMPAGARAVRGLHPGRDRRDHRHLGDAAEERAMDDVSRHAEGAHHVRAEHVNAAK